MQKQYQLALHVFRRDLRLQDNSALIEALNTAEQVIPCFIFDPRQLENNPYRSEHCVAFMHRSLQDLNEALQQKNSRLYYFYGIAEEIIAQLLDQHSIDAVFINRDYTPFSLQRDHAIKESCLARKRAFHCVADSLLNEPEQILKSNNKPYTVYTPYRNKAAEQIIQAPTKNTLDNYYHSTLNQEASLSRLKINNYPDLVVKGGRKEGITLLKQIKTLGNYAETRNLPAIDNGTSKLSAHNKFGTISIREFYHVVLNCFGRNNTLITELYWRDFFTQISFHFPHVFGHAYHQKYDAIKWKNNEAYFRAWCEGKTGFPIIDAGMRELNSTGYMHNRVRMITASFLTKDLHIDWRWGEKYFAQQLVDYDPAVNNGNWQWAASTGCDAQPYFRIFNPWLQQKKYDPGCLYIKRYVPELAHVDCSTIHKLDNNFSHSISGYPTPIVTHAVASKHAKSLFSI